MSKCILYNTRSLKQQFILFPTLLLVLMYSCQWKGEQSYEVGQSDTTETKQVRQPQQKQVEKSFLDTTFVFNKQTFRIETQPLNEDSLLMFVWKNSEQIQTDTLDAVALIDISLKDFDNNGSNDILLSYIGNNPAYDLYLFDQRSHTFRFLNGFDRFPEAIQLKSNPRYYYSYHRAGCADLNWVSDLFYIENFNTIHVGHLYGQGCDFEVQENPQVIEIYKVDNNEEENKTLVEKLPYHENVTDFDDKWEFIQHYWNNNYKKVTGKK